MCTNDDNPAALQVAPLVGSGFGYCANAAGNTTGEVDAALPSSAGGVASLSEYNVVPRTTIINEKCRLPVVWGSASHPLRPVAFFLLSLQLCPND